MDSANTHAQCTHNNTHTNLAVCLQARIDRLRSDAESMQRDLAEKLWDAEQRVRWVLGSSAACIGWM